jgi:adenylate cyclase
MVREVRLAPMPAASSPAWAPRHGLGRHAPNLCPGHASGGYASRVAEQDRVPAEQAADRAGVTPDYVARLTKLGLLAPQVSHAPDGTARAPRYSTGDVRRIQVMAAMERTGLSLDGLAALVRDGAISLDFVGAASYQVFAPLSETTFAELSEQTGAPIDLLMVMREATGGAHPAATDRVREDELSIVPLIVYLREHGYRDRAIEQTLRVYGDSTRRIAEMEADAWRTEFQEPLLAAGHTAGVVGDASGEFSVALAEHTQRALMATYHAQQMLAWLANIAAGMNAALVQAGLGAREEQPPAMCFLDITGYTRLTQERGDSAAVDLADRLARLVQRTSVQHGGRAVKWLGDGVMLHFPEPAPGVTAALEMVSAVADAGLPPAHVGLDAGPVVFQEGDYFGQTVNVASRIGEYARPGEVLVSQAVAQAAEGARHLRFDEIGPVELKGVSGVMRLFAAHRAT